MTRPPLRIVAVHGNGGGSTRFRPMQPFVPESVEFEAIDLPGFNGVPADAALRSVADFADHLAGLLAERTSRDGDCGDGDVSTVVLGHGIGGSIALDLASRRPGVMSGLILHAPVGADLDSRLFPKLMSPAPVRAVIRRAIAARPLRPIWRRAFFPTGAPSQVLDEFFEGYRHCASFSQMFDIIDAAWFERLTPVTDVPTTLLWGEHDRVLKSGQTDGIRSKAPEARVVIEPGWDHFPMIEQPEEYARVIARLATDLVASS